MERRGVVHKRWRAALVGVAAGALLLAGCGDSEDETITKAAYIKQAGAICKKGNAAREKAVQAWLDENQDGEFTGDLPKAEGEELVLDVALPPFAQMVEELAELDEPEQGAKQADEFVKRMEEGIETIESEPKRILDGKVDPWNKAQIAAAAYGIEGCRVL